MNSFRFIERGHQGRDRAPGEDPASAAGRSSRRRCTSTPPPARSPRCAPRRRRTTTATSPSPTCCRWRSTRQMLEARARGDVRAARPIAPSASQRELGAERRERPAARLPRRARRLLRGGARAPAPSPRRPPQTLANWITGELRRRACEDGEDPARLARARRARSRALVGLVAAKRVSVGAARQVLDRLVAEGGDPRGDRRGRGARGDGRRGRARRDRRGGAGRPTPTPRERVREGNAKAIGPIVGHVMRETKGRADGTEVTRLVHEQLGSERADRADLLQHPDAPRRRHFGLPAKGKRAPSAPTCSP